MNFSAARRVRFSDCDPAGIVFFPQYFTMLNGFVEQWFDEALGLPYAQLIAQRRVGLPTVRLEAQFTAVSRHGDDLALSLVVAKLGRSSLLLAHRFTAGSADGAVAEVRLLARQVLVCTSLATHRPQPLPDDIRAAVAAFAHHDEEAS